MTRTDVTAEPMPDLYPHARETALDSKLFANPPAVYRGTPFWSWNNKLDADQLKRQIDYFKRMGFGGAHMHVRTGMATPYLSESYMQVVRECVDHFQNRDMLAWLYDEDRWPSGAAGGLVTQDPRLRIRHLLFTRSLDESTLNDQEYRLGRYAVRLDSHGCLTHYRRLGESEEVHKDEQAWAAYLKTARPRSGFNDQTYVDTLNRCAIERFIEVTHERYRQCVGDRFGTVAPAIFTDEPQMDRNRRFSRPDAGEDVTLPFTDNLPETYQAAYGQDLLDVLPELFWELAGEAHSSVRWRFHDHVTERFTQAFADTIGEWCGRHGLRLTGHMMEEPTLFSQTHAIGEAMRAYRGFQLPGIDILCDHREYNTAKQAQSAARQYGRPGVLSELYGVTNWDYDFVGHKGQGDWQAALGVTVRVPHLAWVSMLGEAKRDYPASIGYQSPWFEQYPVVEDHFARLNTVLTRGTPRAHIGVVHPIESYWLCYGPVSQTEREREQREQRFAQLTDWLLFGLLDFDFIAESLLPEQCPEPAREPALAVGAMRYQAIVVPSMRTIRATTLGRLEAMHEAGGTVIFAGEVPTLLDAEPSSRCAAFADEAKKVAFDRLEILNALEPFRDVMIHRLDGRSASTCLYQMRDDGDRRHLFVCNTDRTHRLDAARIRVAGKWQVDWLDTHRGAQQRIASTVTEAGDTEVMWDLPAHGHLLVTLSPRQDDTGAIVRRHDWPEQRRLADPVPITLHEPNALLLNQARWRIDEEPWQECEELLRIDTAVRERFNLPRQSGAMTQPWADTTPSETVAWVELSFEILSDIDVTSPQLALEEAAQTQILLDGQRIEAEPDGYYVDEAIETVPLPTLSAGRHELRLRFAMHRQHAIEWCYLLGDFGVEARGRHARITPPVRELAFGDWTRQGLPFYTGNVTYHCSIRGDDGAMGIEVPHFRNPVLRTALDGRDLGAIAFDPFRVSLGKLDDRVHTLDLMAFGHRFNGFGALHNVDPDLRWFGPMSWRSTGVHWAYEYQLKPMGITSAPRVCRVPSDA